jgi:hypothetical protein
MWKCPACQTSINHNPAEQGPTPRTRYRCHVCRLELALDESTGRLDVVPLESLDDSQPPRATSHSTRQETDGY